MTAVHATLLLDLYQLTMGQAYFYLGMKETAVFELFVRRLPATRRFLLLAGIAQAMEYLEELQFKADELEFLAGLGTFSPAFLDHLASLRFTGSVHAMQEGTPFFADEPILRITAPILEAQLVESRLLNIVHFQTLIASKAARCVTAAAGRQLVDFGMRRAHEADAGLYAARAAYLAGFHATATVEAGKRFAIPLSGTMAHSFIEAHAREEAAFRGFVTSGLDEHRIAELVNGGAPADAFGVGTALDTSADAPALDMAYKLQEYAGRPRRKRSSIWKLHSDHRHIQQMGLIQPCPNIKQRSAGSEPMMNS
jgi:nicotinate phosphoribosyltransferase